MSQLLAPLQPLFADIEAPILSPIMLDEIGELSESNLSQILNTSPGTSLID